MKKLVMLVITMILAVGAFSGTEAEAASKNKKALKAYADYVKSQNVSKFAVADVNGDGVKELLSQDSLYIYKSGKVVEAAYGIGFRYSLYPNKNYIFYNQQYDTSGAEGYYRLTKKGKLKELAYNERTGNDFLAEYGVCEKEKHIYRVNGKKVSKKKYNAYVKKLTKNAKQLKPKYRKNTAKNRKKYLKA